MLLSTRYNMGDVVSYGPPTRFGRIVEIKLNECGIQYAIGNGLDLTIVMEDEIDCVYKNGSK